MFSVMHSIVQSQAVQFCAMLFIFLVLPPLAQSCQLKMNNLVQFFKNLCEVHWNNVTKKKNGIIIASTDIF